MPLISVIVPVYNVEPYLKRCIESVLAQTFTDFELILIDDGSPDNSGEICDEYIKKDSRIHVIHQDNGGLSAARNAGIDWAFEKSDSQWLAFVDSDDWVHPRYLEYLLQAVIEEKTKASACGIVRVESEVEMSETQFSVNCEQWDHFYLESWVRGVVAVNKLYSKELFKDMRYPVGKLHEDEFLTYRLLAKAGTISYVDANLYYYYQNPNSIMKSEFSIAKLDGIQALKEQCEFGKNNGFLEFFEDRQNALMNKTASLISLCNESKTLSTKDKKRALTYLRKELKELLAAKRSSISTPDKRGWYYNLAYPKLMWCYWTTVGITKKIKRFIIK